MRVLKHIDVLSSAKVSAVLCAIWGFIIALISLPFIAIAGTFGTYAGSTATGLNMAPLMLGLGAVSIIVMPIIMAIVGFIMGAIGAFFYNIAAKYVGGIQLDL